MPKCSYCKHPYTRPCNGKDKRCPNKVFMDNQKKGKKK